MSTAANRIYELGLINVKPAQLLRPFAFDFWLLIGISILALASGMMCAYNHALFPLVLFLDLWILGYHHVISTYTRLCFDLKSLREHKFLVMYLPFLVAIPCVGLFFYIGPWVLASIYLYWQWFHYTRQSYGVSRIYARKSAELSPYDENLNTYILYGIPLIGILFRSWQAPTHFIGLELKVIPIPFILVQITTIVVSVIFCLWCRSQWKQHKKGILSKSRLLFLVSHFTIFIVSYLVIDHINIGWLVINIWHNAQYILIVWLYNNNRFKKGVTEDEKFLSSISQSNKWILYGFICIGLSTLMYAGLREVTSDYTSALPLAIVIYSVINFHHYVVDGIIWKVRKKEVRQNLLAS